MPILTAREAKMLEEARRRTAATFSTTVEPIPGWEMGWEAWNRKWWPNTLEFAPHHRRAWEWLDSLEQGKAPEHDALVEAWNRGGGKTTTVEHGVTWTGVKASRKFWICVCATQEAADLKVSNVGAAMERMGIGRAMSMYGVAEGWSANKLRCDNGFNVLAIGLLNAKSRGLKLDELRPDGIWLDDIDSAGETVYMTGRKLDTIQKAILPSGATDCVTIFVQNVIAPSGVMQQILDGRADMLHNRLRSKPVPAIYDMQGDFYYKDGEKRFRITGGTPSWVGKPLDVCQREIDTEGYEPFMEESQHDVYRSGVFFSNWSEERHVRLVNAPEGRCRVCGDEPKRRDYCQACGGSGFFVPAPLPIPRGWSFYGGLDYGRSERNPFAFLLFATDFDGNDHVIGEVYEAQLSPEEQADRVLGVLKSHGVKPSDCVIYCDPSFFPPRELTGAIRAGGQSGGWQTMGRPVAGWSMFTNNGKHVSDVYLSKGLRVVPAMGANTRNERVNGWAACNQYLDKPGAFVVYEGCCPNFVNTIKTLARNVNDSLDVDTHGVDHLADCWRFKARNKGLIPPPPKSEDRVLKESQGKPSSGWYSG